MTICFGNGCCWLKFIFFSPIKYQQFKGKNTFVSDEIYYFCLLFFMGKFIAGIIWFLDVPLIRFIVVKKARIQCQYVVDFRIWKEKLGKKLLCTAAAFLPMTFVSELFVFLLQSKVILWIFIDKMRHFQVWKIIFQNFFVATLQKVCYFPN